MSSSNEESLPLPPYLEVRPPTDIAKRDRRTVVYGFPLTEEWLEIRYHHDVELQPPEDEGSEIQPRGAYLMRLIWHLTALCETIHRVKSRVVFVETSGYGEGQIMLLVVGYPGRKPPPDTLEALVDKLLDYGVVENPGWYPRA